MERMTQKELIEVVSGTDSPFDFLQKIFFTGGKVYNKSKLTIQKYTDRITPAGYVADEDSAPRVAQSLSFEDFEVTPPVIKYEVPISKRELRDVQPGGTEYNPRTVTQDYYELLGRTIKKQRADIGLAIELQCSELLQNGKVQVGREIDFLRNSNNRVALAGTSKWDSSSADILKNLREWRDIGGRSGLIPTVAILGVDAYDSLMSHKATTDLLDLKNVDIGKIDVQYYAKMGASYVGRLKGIGLDIWVYEKQYMSGSTETNILPKGGVALGNPDAKANINYSNILHADGDSRNFDQRDKIFIKEISKDGNLSVHIESHPLACLSQADAFVYAEAV